MIEGSRLGAEQVTLTEGTVLSTTGRDPSLWVGIGVVAPLWLVVSSAVSGAPRVLAVVAIAAGLGAFFALSKNLATRCLWWIAFGPLAAAGFTFSGYFVSIVDILGCSIVLNYVVERLREGVRVPFRAMALPLLGFSLLLVAAVSVAISPIGSPNPGPLLRFGLLLGTAMAVRSWVKKRSNPLNQVRAFGLQIATFGIWGVSKYFFESWGANPLAWLRLTGDNPRILFDNELAFILVICGPALLAVVPERPRWRPAVLLIVLLGFLAATLSRAAYAIALFDVCVVAGWALRRKRTLLALVSVAAVCVAILLVITAAWSHISPRVEGSNQERLTALEAGLRGFVRYPVLGIGFGQWILLHELPVGDNENEFFSARYKQGEVSMNPHNTLVRAVLDTGALGLSLFLGVLVAAGRPLWRALRPSGGLFVANSILYRGLALAFLNATLLLMTGDYLESPALWSLLVIAELSAFAASEPHLARQSRETTMED